MVSHNITLALDDDRYKQLVFHQEREGKHFTVDGKPVSSGMYAKELLLRQLDVLEKVKKTTE
jgi:hypothetical protein